MIRTCRSSGSLVRLALLRVVVQLLTYADAAYLLVSAATTLLRAAIESAHQAKVDCVLALLGLSERLSAARKTLNWDIGDFCLQRCKPTIDKLATALGVARPENAGDVATAGEVAAACQQDAPDSNVPSLSLNSDFLLPLDSLDYQYDLFDDVAGSWPMNV